LTQYLNKQSISEQTNNPSYLEELKAFELDIDYGIRVGRFWKRISNNQNT
jgi:hypothetical protein